MIFKTDSISSFKQKALHWAANFEVCCYLDSNNFTDPYSKFDLLIAAGIKHDVTDSSGNAFTELANFKNRHPQEWMTGFFSYDLKNETEQLQSSNADHLSFPDLYFFIPEHLIVVKDGEIDIQSEDAEDLFREINKTDIILNDIPRDFTIYPRFSRNEYIETVNKIKEHISRGDIYVTNFCQEFYAEQAQIDPVNVFERLNEISPKPFGCFFKYYDKYIISASPERFLAKRGNKLISQPIKGTAPRSADHQQDVINKSNLRNNSKEQQENVMIVDLVRNDLTRSAKPGTVKVEELFGIYSFEQVHQMISTIVCELADDVNMIDAIKNAFPMGSMTGAPKVSAMQLMEQYELTRRGIYSGAIGYLAPDGDFDFNVVIRTILYNATARYLSFQAGSAITYHADAEKEFEECLLKVKAILAVLARPISYPQP
ncbi:anthranilate synthase component I family protein [Mucilaginibacter sp. KACC 22063]|uniref:anthranilate synthase component I family protein n=1 Tax=Mucilaginibacter sp. KACC 22063 TaxID=3025666 RepID=UPI0030824051